MQPVIGVTMNLLEGKYVLNEPYVQSILEAGGVPLCVPFGVENSAAQIISHIDGLLLTGGFDIEPSFFRETRHPKLGEVIIERDIVEFELLKEAMKRKKPILSICRGIQVLNVLLGGTLYQDINSQIKGKILPHQQQSARDEVSHEVKIEPKSKLYEIINTEKIFVNSLHHQALKDVASNLRIVATATDGIIEAVELEQYPFCIAVQWHPEELAKKGEPTSKKLFKAFINACKQDS